MGRPQWSLEQILALPPAEQEGCWRGQIGRFDDGRRVYYFLAIHEGFDSGDVSFTAGYEEDLPPAEDWLTGDPARFMARRLRYMVYERISSGGKAGREACAIDHTSGGVEEPREH